MHYVEQIEENGNESLVEVLTKRIHEIKTSFDKIKECREKALNTLLQFREAELQKKMLILESMKLKQEMEDK